MKPLGSFKLDLERNVYDGHEHVTVTCQTSDGTAWDLVSFVERDGKLWLTRHEAVGTPDEFLTDELGRMVPDDEVIELAPGVPEWGETS